MCSMWSIKILYSSTYLNVLISYYIYMIPAKFAGDMQVPHSSLKLSFILLHAMSGAVLSHAGRVFLKLFNQITLVIKKKSQAVQKRPPNRL